MGRPHNNATLLREIPVLYVEDIMLLLGIGQSKAYQIMRKINKELEAEGYETISGRVSEARFREKFYCGTQAEPLTTRSRQPRNVLSLKEANA